MRNHKKLLNKSEHQMRQQAISKTGGVMLAGLYTLCSLLITAPVFGNAQGDPLYDVKRQIRAEFPTVEHVSVEQLSDWLSPMVKQPPLLLDVRELEEYEVSHIQGATLTPRIEQVTAILDKQPKDRITIVYCAVGYRSSVMAKRLQQRGYSHVYNLEGSIFEWANKGYPLYQGERSASSVHPYNFWWGRLLDDGFHGDY